MVKKQTKSEKLIKEVRRNTRQVYNAEQKILIVIEGNRQCCSPTMDLVILLRSSKIT